MKKILLYLISAIAGVSGAMAQAPAPAGGQQGTKIRTLLFKLAPQLTEVYAFDPSDQSGTPGVKLDVKGYLNDIGSSMVIKGNALILTTSASRDSLSKPESIVANVRIGSARQSLILMLIPGPGKPGEPLCRAVVYDSRAAAFPMATYQITNLSPYPVKYQLGANSYEFKSGEMKLLKDVPISESGTTPMLAQCFKNNQWQRIASSEWSAPGSSREIQVLFENPKNGRVEMEGFQDTSIE